MVLTLLSERALLDASARRISEGVAQNAAGIDEEAKRLALLTATLAADKRLITAAERYDAAGSDEDAFAQTQVMDEHVVGFFDFTNRTGAVAILLAHKPTYVYRNNPSIFEEPVPRTGWFSAVVANKNRVYILQSLKSYSLSGGDQPVLTVAVCPSAQAYDAGVYAILVASRIPYLDSIQAERDGGHMQFLTNARGELILSNGALKGGAASDLLQKIKGGAHVTGREVLDGKPYLVATAGIPSAGWTLVSAISYDQVTRSIENYARGARIAVIALLVLFALYVELFFHQILRPVRLVVEKMDLVSRGDYSAAVSVKAPAEIRNLAESFNAMVREVNRLTAEKEQKEKERAALELEALRLQINPHFLSNTLNAIRLMAVMSKADNIRVMTAALMKVVSEAFSGGPGSLASVAAEFETLDSYVQIMKVRFGDSFDVTFKVDPSVGSCRMLRMLLQPILENSILHGLQNIDRKGYIVVQASREGADSDGAGVLSIEISDNGLGMTAEEIERSIRGDIPQDLTFNRVGIANVRRRIELNHGEAYGLSIHSVPGEGTSVSVRLPVLEETERADAGVDSVSGDGR